MSGYPPEMQESIRKVEASRARRMKETFPAMSMEEREAILKTFHPDYKEENARAIRVGVSKGQRMPLELADVVEGRPRILSDFDLSGPVAEADVLIIGGGPAGLTAGLYTDRDRLRSLLIEKGLIGGTVNQAERVDNYPGFPDGISGPELTRRMHEQATKFGLETVYEVAHNLAKFEE
ncbi:hypothetical protein FDZ71_18235, partial [bacterium]